MLRGEVEIPTARPQLVRRHDICPSQGVVRNAIAAHRSSDFGTPLVGGMRVAAGMKPVSLSRFRAGLTGLAVGKAATHLILRFRKSRSRARE
jgi:hypothetical protein